jgi:hypothetical protein
MACQTALTVTSTFCNHRGGLFSAEPTDVLLEIPSGSLVSKILASRMRHRDKVIEAFLSQVCNFYMSPYAQNSLNGPGLMNRDETHAWPLKETQAGCLCHVAGEHAGPPLHCCTRIIWSAYRALGYNDSSSFAGKFTPCPPAKHGLGGIRGSDDVHG